MSASSRFFRELWSGAREINYGNTVLVLRDDGPWWLGYVQDVRGQDLLVDFDASAVPAQWIHTSRPWPHHCLPDDVLHPYVECRLQVALREHHDGPMVFRPATVVAAWHDQLLGVRLDEKQPADCFFVHRFQFVERLPVPGDGESFFTRTDGLMYIKHVIRFPAAQQLRHVDRLPVFVDRTCQFRLAEGDSLNRLMGKTISGPGSACFYLVGPRLKMEEERNAEFGVHVECRVFLRAGSDTVTFVCLEVHNEAAGRRMSWNEEALQSACYDCLRRESAAVFFAFPSALQCGQCLQLYTVVQVDDHIDLIIKQTTL
ncbi:uncharacterized protein LOC129590927 [Paramacrobiotus metropolitanus]|uniref:uncharacterized protein LOC129590927 n=1 Tax=Paramacrobiotus metropolitanus TaxID=2943436 RepID=UPI002445A812|nr:uncharacterized protein LOC129590927 [Paramacrobiotus metropolitanus]